MKAPFTNVHLHIFDTDCAPDRFLRIIPFKPLRVMSKPIKNLFEVGWIRLAMHTLGGKTESHTAVGKYIAFLDIGLESSQLNIFEKVLAVAKQYDSEARLVGLTLNMDYMDSMPSKGQKTFETQLSEVMQVKEYYYDNFFPFLCVDPRHKSGKDLVDWAKKYFESGFSKNGKIYPYFYGIKLYPSLGFFPFDPKLEELYAYAEEKGLPVMTHCTRSGSLYIGEMIETLIPKEPNFIVSKRPEGQPAEVAQANKNILDRIAKYYEKGWVKNNKLGANDLACDLFGHPENYMTVVDRFPKLKICLAHLGGSYEIIKNVASKSSAKELAEIRTIDPLFWSDRIIAMMKKYDHLYTDISYTLSDLGLEDIKNKILEIFKDEQLKNRILFGTDFFMTEQERKESDLYQIIMDTFSKEELNLLCHENPKEYLMID